jgi:hypothetical protein
MGCGVAVCDLEGDDGMERDVDFEDALEAAGGLDGLKGRGGFWLLIRSCFV